MGTYAASVGLFPCQVSIGQCTEGIIQVSEKTKTLNPRQQDTFMFEISASLNMDFQHNCTSEYVVVTYVTSVAVALTPQLCTCVHHGLQLCLQALMALC